MTKRIVPFLAATTCAILAAGSMVKTDEKDARRGDARQVTTLFLDAALNGQLKEAAALAEPGKAYSREEKIKEFAELKVKSLKLHDVRADAEDALAVTEEVTGDHQREGFLVLTLVKKDDVWWIRDVDLETKESVKGEVDRFMKANPDAKDVPEEKAEK